MLAWPLSDRHVVCESIPESERVGSIDEIRFLLAAGAGVVQAFQIPSWVKEIRAMRMMLKRGPRWYLVNLEIGFGEVHISSSSLVASTALGLDSSTAILEPISSTTIVPDENAHLNVRV